MAFCMNCGTRLNDDAQFCPSCGTATSSADQSNATVQSEVMPQFSASDINENKGISVLSYIGLLVLIPLLAKKESPYAQFHAKQGLNLCIFEIAYSILSALLSFIKLPVYHTYFGVSVGVGYATPWFISVPLLLLGLCFTALAIVGIVFAATGEAKELPVIGKLNFGEKLLSLFK